MSDISYLLPFFPYSGDGDQTLSYDSHIIPKYTCARIYFEHNMKTIDITQCV